MKFNYSEIQNPDPLRPSGWRPYLHIRLIHEKNSQDVIVLVDSGADHCLFPLVVGEILGLDIKSGRLGPGRGISGARFNVYYHRIRLVVHRLAGIDLEVGFTDALTVGAGVLGQTGFFEQFNIKFELHKRQFDVAQI